MSRKNKKIKKGEDGINLEDVNFGNKSNKKSTSKKSKKRKKEHKEMGIFKKIFIFLIVLILIIGAIFYWKTDENGGGARGALITLLGLSKEEVDNLETINVLLLGISEDLESRLTDTIIICSYNPQTQKASMLSIPRDTFIGKKESLAKGSDKINALYAKSPEKLLSSIKNITGLEINYYVVINNNALIQLVDAIGGVEFDVPIDMDYDDPTQDLHIHLSKGLQKINGEKAEQLLRFRHNNNGTSYPVEYGDNDFGRMRTQREFISETVKQTLNVKNLPKAWSIYNAVFNNIETNLEKDIINAYIPTAIGFSTSNITSKQLPGESKKLNNLWFFVHNKKQTKEIVSEMFEIK